MHGGLDVGPETVAVATESDVTRTQQSLAGLEADAIASFLDDLVDEHGTPGASARFGCVDRDGLPALLARAGDQVDATVEPVDPGMAVCYDVFGDGPTGVGVCLSDGRGAATLAVGGIPVATARVAYEDRWYDVTEQAAAVTGTGPQAAWARARYEALLDALATTLTADAPALGAPVDVAIAGSDTPAQVDAQVAATLGAAFGTDVASVVVPETPADGPSRGALVAVQESEPPGVVPGVAATTAYTPELADTATAATQLGDGVEPVAVAPGADGDEPTGAAPDRSSSRLAAALDRVVGSLDGDHEAALADLREDFETTVADIEERVETVETEADTVETVRADVAAVEEAVGDLETDVSELQAALAGLDGETADGDALGSVATDALQSDIEAVEADLSSRIEGLWDELDDVDDQLVDLSAQVDSLPTVEEELAATTESVEGLTDETADLRRSLAEVDERVERLSEQTATTTALDAVRADLDGLGSDLDELETSFETLDRADPATVAEVSRDLDALTETVVDHAKRLDGVERTASDLDDRITQAFQDTAKAEALSSLQAEVSRIRETASTASEQAGGAVDTASDLDETVGQLETEVDGLRQTLDGLAESSATRSEVGDLQTRVEELERDQQALRDRLGGGGLSMTLTAVGLASVGLLGALLSLELGEPVFAVGFGVLVVGPAAWLGARVAPL